jgi:hypothetical protein
VKLPIVNNGPAWMCVGSLERRLSPVCASNRQPVFRLGGILNLHDVSVALLAGRLSPRDDGAAGTRASWRALATSSASFCVGTAQASAGERFPDWRDWWSGDRSPRRRHRRVRAGRPRHPLILPGLRRGERAPGRSSGSEHDDDGRLRSRQHGADVSRHREREWSRRAAMEGQSPGPGDRMRSMPATRRRL